MTATADTDHAALIEELCLIRQEHENGTVIYRNHLGEIHRVHGPAEVWPDGTQYWVQNGLPHRTDGPAAIFADGTCYWYLQGRELSEEEFEAMTLANKMMPVSDSSRKQQIIAV